MPVSLNLPYAVCYPLTRLARSVRPLPRVEDYEHAAYFEHQYRDTGRRYAKHMEGLDLAGKTVLDVGGGLGGRALGWLDLGASSVVTIDINRQELEAGRAILTERYPERARRVEFRHADEMAGAATGDVAILFDCFEHLADPAAVLRQVHGWLQPGGLVWIGSIGWYNHMASHCSGYIPIPWCQVLFSEMAIIKTIRALLHSPDYTPYIWDQLEGLDRWDNVTTLRDRPGEPLNMLSLRRVRRVLAESPFRLDQFRVFGIGGKQKVANLAAPLARLPVARELFHSYYTVLLSKPGQ